MATSDSPLSVPNITLAVARPIGAGGGGSNPTPDGETLWGPYVATTRPAGSLWTDTFEEGTWDIAATEISYDRGSSPATSIVTGDNTVVCSSTGPINPPAGPFPDKLWESSPLGAAGNNALRCSYDDASTYPWSEFSVDLATPTKKLWVRWDLRVPINFEHLWPNLANNNKLFAIWMDAYGTGKEGSLVVGEFRANSDTDKGSYFYWSWLDDTGYTSSQGATPFITYPDDQGRWMELTMCFTSVSANGAGDGSIEVWRRWQDEATPTKTHEFLNKELILPTTAGLPQGWKHMYFMGEHRSAYNERTDWLIDNIEYSTESLL